MRLENKSERTLQHHYYDKENKLQLVNLLPNQNADIPDDVARIWLNIKGVVEYKDPAEAKAEKKALEDENAKLKAEIEKLKKAASTEVKAVAKKVKK